MLGNNSETNQWILCLWMLKCRWSHALQVCQLSTRYLDKQIIYGGRKRTNLFKLYQDLGWNRYLNNVFLAIALRLVNGFQVFKRWIVGLYQFWLWAKIQLVILTKISSIVEGTRLTRFHFIKKWIKTAIEKIVCLAITLRLINGFYVCEC